MLYVESNKISDLVGNDAVDPGQDPDLEVEKGKSSHQREVDQVATNGFQKVPAFSTKDYCYSVTQYSYQNKNILSKI